MPHPRVDRVITLCYTTNNTPATLPAARLSATRRVFNFHIKKALETSLLACCNIYKSTRRASDRKVKQAGFVFYNGVLEFSNFVCYTIINKPATPPNFRVSAHFRQALFFRELFI